MVVARRSTLRDINNTPVRPSDTLTDASLHSQNLVRSFVSLGVVAHNLRSVVRLTTRLGTPCPVEWSISCTQDHACPLYTPTKTTTYLSCCRHDVKKHNDSIQPELGAEHATHVDCRLLWATIDPSPLVRGNISVSCVMTSRQRQARARRCGSHSNNLVFRVCQKHYDVRVTGGETRGDWPGVSLWRSL